VFLQKKLLGGITMKKQILSLAAGAALLLAAQSSFAVGMVTATGSPLSYDVVLTAGCTASVVGGGNLSTQSPPYAPVADALAGTVTVNCTNTTVYGVCVDAGLNDGGTGARNLADGANLLPYTLDNAVGAGTLVGDGGCTAVEATYGGDTTVDSMVSGTGDTTDQTVDLYADVTVLPTSAPGTYSDTVDVTVVW
jgi:spore coat protein U-like protein